MRKPQNKKTIRKQKGLISVTRGRPIFISAVAFSVLAGAIAAQLAFNSHAATTALSICPGVDVIWESNAQYTGEPYPYGPPPGPYYLNNAWFNYPTGSELIWLQNGGTTWGVCSKQAGGNGQAAYPSVNLTVSPHNNVNTYSTISSSFAESNSPVPPGNWHFMYDVFANTGGAKSADLEVETITYEHESQGGTNLGPASIDGKNYTVYKNTAQSDQHVYYTFLINNNETSGTVNIKAEFNWLHNNAGLALNIPLDSIAAGWEIASVSDGAGNAERSFYMSSFSTTLN